jgi:hypothetical protein
LNHCAPSVDGEYHTETETMNTFTKSLALTGALIVTAALGFVG